MGHMSQMPVPPHQVAEHVPIAISDTVMRALAKDPADRFQTAEEFLRACNRRQQLVTRRGGHHAAAHSARTHFSSHPQCPAIPLSSQQPKQTTASGPLSAPLEEVTRKLALYIGPVASSS